MNDELDITLDELDQVDASANGKLQVKNRFQKLSTQVIEEKAKVEQISKEKDAAEAKAAEIAKENEFYKSFSSHSAKYPNAIQHQDKILEKVKAGYETEDAILAVLGKEGQQSAGQPAPRSISAEGGSSINIVSDGEKSLDNMSRAEKLSALEDMEKSGELNRVLRSGLNIG